MAIQARIEIDGKEIYGFLDIRGGRAEHRRIACELYLFFAALQPDHVTIGQEYVARIVWEPIEPMNGMLRDCAPLVSLNEESAHQLADLLWRCHVKPKAAGGSAGQLEAMQAHLTDLQQMVNLRSAEVAKLDDNHRDLLKMALERVANLQKQLDDKQATIEQLLRPQVVSTPNGQKVLAHEMTHFKFIEPPLSPECEKIKAKIDSIASQMSLLDLEKRSKQAEKAIRDDELDRIIHALEQQDYLHRDVDDLSWSNGAIEFLRSMLKERKEPFQGP